MAISRARPNTTHCVRNQRISAPAGDCRWANTYGVAVAIAVAEGLALAEADADGEAEALAPGVAVRCGLCLPFSQPRCLPGGVPSGGCPGVLAAFAPLFSKPVSIK